MKLLVDSINKKREQPQKERREGNKMKRRRARIQLFVGFLSMLALAAVALPNEAQAQSSGQIILTQEKIPTNVSKKELRKFLKKNRKSVLTQKPGSKSYQMYAAVRLRRKPSQADLKRNSGQIHVAFYEKQKRGWKYVNVMHIGYSEGLTLILPLQITDDLGLNKGKRYQMRITIFDARKKEVVLARTEFRLK